MVDLYKVDAILRKDNVNLLLIQNYQQPNYASSQLYQTLTGSPYHMLPLILVWLQWTVSCTVPESHLKHKLQDLSFFSFREQLGSLFKMCISTAQNYSKVISPKATPKLGWWESGDSNWPQRHYAPFAHGSNKSTLAFLSSLPLSPHSVTFASLNKSPAPRYLFQTIKETQIKT